MYQAPEIFHLERAVKAVKENLAPEKKLEPDNENDQTNPEEETTERESDT